MWTPTTRRQHSRTVTRYQTDLTDAEWRVIAPHLPKPYATGRPREWPMREIVNGIFYVMRAGCAWRLLPNDLPPWGTIYRWFAAWRDDGRFERINHRRIYIETVQDVMRGLRSKIRSGRLMIRARQAMAADAPKGGELLKRRSRAGSLAAYGTKRSRRSAIAISILSLVN
jgi:transposase